MRIQQEQSKPTVIPSQDRKDQIIRYCLKRFQEKDDKEAITEINKLDNSVLDDWMFEGLSPTGMYVYSRKFPEGYQKTFNVDVDEARGYIACVEHAVQSDSEVVHFRETRIKIRDERKEKLIELVKARNAPQKANIQQTVSKIDDALKGLSLNDPPPTAA